jgi:hypothetical protein
VFLFQRDLMPRSVRSPVGTRKSTGVGLTVQSIKQKPHQTRERVPSEGMLRCHPQG